MVLGAGQGRYGAVKNIYLSIYISIFLDGHDGPNLRGSGHSGFTSGLPFSVVILPDFPYSHSPFISQTLLLFWG